MRLIEEEALKDNTAEVHAILPVEIAAYLLNEKRQSIIDIEKRQAVVVLIVPSSHMLTPQYDVQRIRESEVAEREEKPTSYKLAHKHHESTSTATQPPRYQREPAAPVKHTAPDEIPAITTPPAPISSPYSGMSADSKGQPGLIKKLFNFLFEKKEQQAEAGTPRQTTQRHHTHDGSGHHRSSSSTMRRRGQGGRYNNQRGGNRRRGGRHQGEQRHTEHRTNEQRETGSTREPREHNREPRQHREHREHHHTPREHSTPQEHREHAAPRSEQSTNTNIAQFPQPQVIELPHVPTTVTTHESTHESTQVTTTTSGADSSVGNTTENREKRPRHHFNPRRRHKRRPPQQPHAHAQDEHQRHEQVGEDVYKTTTTETKSEE
jgi:ribonuclease E